MKLILSIGLLVIASVAFADRKFFSFYFSIQHIHEKFGWDIILCPLLSAHKSKIFTKLISKNVNISLEMKYQLATESNANEILSHLNLYHSQCFNDKNTFALLVFINRWKWWKASMRSRIVCASWGCNKLFGFNSTLLSRSCKWRM